MEIKSARTLPTAAKGGVKRSLLTDVHGLPLSQVIAGAHRHDNMLLKETLARIVVDRPTNLSRSWLCLDLGYVGRRVYEHVWQIGMVPWIRGRRDERKPSTKVRRRGAGSSNGRIAGSIVIDAC